jgi:hypothetical protein
MRSTDPFTDVAGGLEKLLWFVEIRTRTPIRETEPRLQRPAS